MCAKDIVQHLYRTGHNTKFVIFVTEQGHLEVVVELGQTGVFGGSPVEDGKSNTQYVLLAGFILDVEGLGSCQPAAMEHQETEVGLDVPEPENHCEVT